MNLTLPEALRYWQMEYLKWGTNIQKKSKNWKKSFLSVFKANIFSLKYGLYRTMYTFRIYMILHNSAFHVN